MKDDDFKKADHIEAMESGRSVLWEEEQHDVIYISQGSTEGPTPVKN